MTSVISQILYFNHISLPSEMNSQMREGYSTNYQNLLMIFFNYPHFTASLFSKEETFE